MTRSEGVEGSEVIMQKDGAKNPSGPEASVPSRDKVIPLRGDRIEPPADSTTTDPADALHYQRRWTPDSVNDNDSLTKIFNMVEPQSRVLDVGCSIGQLGAELKTRKRCTVIGVEINQRAAQIARPLLDEVHILDVEKLDFAAQFPGTKFDYVVFADVLEHLRNPAEVLRNAQRVLTPNGSILLSIPNIAHGAVRLALLEGKFEYRGEGLLDATHLKLYTRAELGQLLTEANLVPVAIQRTYLGIFDTEIKIKVEGIITDELVRTIEREPESTTYQFVLETLPASSSALASRMGQQLNTLETHMMRIGAEHAALKIKSAAQEDLLRKIPQQVLALNERMAALSRRVEVTTHASEKLEKTLCEFRTDVAETLRYLASVLGRQGQTLQAVGASANAAYQRLERYTRFTPLRLLRAIRRKILRL